MKFVVTGGAGFIGSSLVRLLLNEGHEVVVIDNLQRGKIENFDGIFEKISFNKLNILEFKKIRKIINDSDGIFHLAALTVVNESFVKENEYYKTNVIGTENILKIAAEFNLKVVFSSSSSVYGNPCSIPIKENFQTKPLHPYGLTKLHGEQLCEKYHKLGAKSISLRYFNVFGENQSPSYAGVVIKFLEKLCQKQSPIIYGNGNQIRDFVYVEDVAKINLAAMESDIDHEKFNVGTGKGISISELAKKLIKIFNLELVPTYDPPVKGDVELSVANIEKAKNLLDWYTSKDLLDWAKTQLI